MVKQYVHHQAVCYLFMVILFCIKFVYSKITNLNHSMDFDQAWPKKKDRYRQTDRQTRFGKRKRTRERKKEGGRICLCSSYGH